MNLKCFLKLFLGLCVLKYSCVSSEGECIKGQLDVLFIIDSSSSVGASDFDLELGIAANLAENFPIGVNGTQFGALKFSDGLSNPFNLNTYTDYQDLKKAILKTQYMSGNASTYLALDAARTFFIPSNGARPGAPKVAIVFTNGRSDDSVRTQQAATLLKSSGVYVIAVGFSNANNQELEAIASASGAVFNFNNFSGVLHSLQAYSNDACNHQVTCAKGQLDVLFIVDSSSSVSINDFNRALGFAANLAENFRIGADAIQFGALTFAENPHNIFDFNTYTEYTHLKTAILHAQYLSGNTHTDLALKNGTDFFFGDHGARREASKVAVIFTNGRSSNSTSTQQQATLLKHSGVYVISVGLSSANNQELLSLASEPPAVFNLDRFDDVLRALQDYANSTCNRAPCIKGQLDVLYVIDSSSTVGATNFNQSLGVAANLAENFHIGADGIQLATITFSDGPHNIFNFSAFTGYKNLQTALLHTAYLSGATNTFLALEESGKFFDASQGAREGAPKVVVVFTSGRSSDSAITVQQALVLKRMGAYVIVVGLPNSNQQELQSIASDPGAVFDISNFSGILLALQDYSSNACKHN